MDNSEAVRRHYEIPGLLDHVRRALEGVPPTPEAQIEVDQFHIMGVEATVDLATKLEIQPEHRFLDVGCGFGGPARYVARQTGAQVVGLDQSEGYPEVARWLAERVGVTAQFLRGDALHLPFSHQTFDRIWMLHVGMNVADKALLFSELRRVLKPDGRLLIFDFVRGDGEPNYPLPWAREASGSHLVTAHALDETLNNVGFRTRVSEDWSDRALEWLREVRHRPKGTPNLVSLVFREDAKAITGNLAVCLLDGSLQLALRIVSE